MIRINLLREARGARRGAGVSMPAISAAGPAEGSPPWAIFITLLLLALLGTLGYGAWLLMQNHNLAVEIAKQQEELKKYEGAREKVKELEQRKQEYTAKVDQIKQLKDQQSVPVKLMNRLVEVLPEGAWYTSVKQAGGTIELLGMAKSIKTISTLYDNLVAMGEFANVQLGEVAQQGGSDEIYSYKLTLAYVPNAKPKEVAPQPVAAAAPRAKAPSAKSSDSME
jgi:Tfp pilus assembly protein PilN